MAHFTYGPHSIGLPIALMAVLNQWTLDSWNFDSWYSLLMDLFTHGTLHSWKPGLIEFWTHSILGFRMVYLAMTLLTCGTFESWNSWLMELLIHGTLKYATPKLFPPYNSPPLPSPGLQGRRSKQAPDLLLPSTPLTSSRHKGLVGYCVNSQWSLTRITAVLYSLYCNVL